MNKDVLRLIGKLIAGAAATAAATYLGKKFFEWAGVRQQKIRSKESK